MKTNRFSLLSVFILTIIISCKSNKNINFNSLHGFLLTDSTKEYYELENNNSITGTRGKVIETDSKFKVKIPRSIIKINSTIGGAGATFKHSFGFKSNQLILLVKNINGKQNLNEFIYSYSEFEDLSFELNFLGEINLKKNRFFGLRKYEEQGYYALFINVKKSELEKFEYSINSLSFPAACCSIQSRMPIKSRLLGSSYAA